MSAAEHWRKQLEGWAIPAELLATVESSPYEWPVELFKRRRRVEADRQEEPFTTELLRRLLPKQGSLLDIGAGTGRASLPLAVEGHSLTAVEPNEAMRRGWAQEAAGMRVNLIEGRWPEVADQVPVHDVAVAAHVVYDVSEIAPFLLTLANRVRVAVVLELTQAHPWSSYATYYRVLHDLERPSGPTVDDLVALVEELGWKPSCELWEREGSVWFESWDEIEELMARRLVLPAARRGELRELLRPDLRERDGRLYLGDDRRKMATVWWIPGQTG